MATHTFQIAGRAVGVRTNSALFSAWLNRALSAYRLDETTSSDFSVLIHDGAESGLGGPRRFNILYSCTETVARSLDVLTVASALLGELESLTFPGRTDAVYLKAALVEVRGINTLMPATMASWLSRLGSRLERASIRLPVVRAVAVDPSRARLVPIAPSLLVRKEAMEDLPRIVHSFANRQHQTLVRGPTKVDAVISLTGALVNGNLVQPMSRGETLFELGSSIMNLPAMGGRALEALGSLLDGVRCYQWGDLARPWSMVQGMLKALSHNPIEEFDEY